MYHINWCRTSCINNIRWSDFPLKSLTEDLVTNLVEAVGCFGFLMVYKLRIWVAINVCKTIEFP